MLQVCVSQLFKPIVCSEKPHNFTLILTLPHLTITMLGLFSAYSHQPTFYLALFSYSDIDFQTAISSESQVFYPTHISQTPEFKIKKKKDSYISLMQEFVPELYFSFLLMVCCLLSYSCLPND